ncbi:PREDICTED: uncharacterized protein LOC105973139 [Erythranthe guttata]|uniref:uncharacterized protein LOC105973139 n=1 Tax=Erythranthe guttata TaxID=4155 RepID=UPI00064DCD4C|nr:PREDICTED: uncharacterized protein LOC105973139 [Erythranthe guttata]|eukprot:XP_012853612.1 PREDICTED: uncharacterized protein LOC105973139 [Erythranthe guttata]
MSCIFWNCQGLGAPLTIHVLGELLRDHRPLLVFLSETKATLSQINNLKSRWNLNGIGVAKVGNSGGLAMFWQKEVDVDLISYSDHHIDVEVSDRICNNKWRVTGFYGKHTIENASKRTNYMAIKLDISKAYDRIEWFFLKKILSHFGIPAVFVDLVMLCVSTVSFSFLFNGAQFGYVKPSRGLRQGDPLSPYLFICCAEALTAMITKASDRGVFHGVRVAASAPTVTSLCFADDTLIFGKATEANSRVLKDILLKYARISRQEINFDKSTMKFSPSTTEELKHGLHQILGFRVVEQHDKYLGLPASIGRTKKEIFAYLRDRVWAKMKGWGEKQLSKAGKEVLIKSVLQAIPSYVMGCFLLPNGLVRHLEAAIRRFWWGNGTKKGMNWLAWVELCKPKSDGGLGFRDLSAFNRALVTKQVWRILSNPNLLLSRIIAARYFPQGELLSARLGSRPSSTWRSIWQVIPFLKMGIRRRIGDGNDTSVWSDPWLREGGNFRIITKRPIYSAFPNKVADLIDDSTHSWNLEVINGVFWPVDIDRILEIPLGCGFAKDKWVWHYSPNGKFTVRSCYHMILASSISSDQQRGDRSGSHSGGNSGDLKFIWHLDIPPKVRIFLWRLCKNILPTNKELYRRKVSSSPLCGRC